MNSAARGSAKQAGFPARLLNDASRSLALTCRSTLKTRELYTPAASMRTTLRSHSAWGRAPRGLVRHSTTLAVVAFVIAQPLVALAQIKGQVRPAATPAWNKGILPISRESYYNAIECGKQGGENPPCVFYDTGLCQNDDFALALYTPYKMVAYEVWRAVRQKQPPPTPSYQEAQRTRITVGVTAVGSKNPLTNLVLKRAGRPVAPVDRSINETGGRFTFDYPAFAATANITLDFVGKARTVSCLIERPVLTKLR
jgi:hypothetical protein